MKIETFNRAKMLMNNNYCKGLNVVSDIYFGKSNTLEILIGDGLGSEVIAETKTRIFLYDLKDILEKYEQIKPYHKRNKIEYLNFWKISNIKLVKEKELKMLIESHNKLNMQMIERAILFSEKYDKQGIIQMMQVLQNNDNVFFHVCIINEAHEKLKQFLKEEEK